MRLIDIFVLNKCGSKKQAKKAIKKGLILVNNHTIEEDIDITDETVIYDSKILDPHPLKYYIIHKPSGYVGILMIPVLLACFQMITFIMWGD